MNSKIHSERTRLYDDGGVAVDICDCGTYTLHVGLLSLRLPLHSMEAVHAALGESLATHASLRLTHWGVPTQA